MQFKTSYNTPFTDRDFERKPPSVPLSGPSGVAVPHVNLAQAASSGHAATTVHGSQGCFQSAPQCQSNSQNLHKGLNSEAYLPPPLRSQNQHGITGAPNEFSASGANPNGFGADFTRQHFNNHHNQYHQQTNQTYATSQNTDFENQHADQWVPSSVVKRDAPSANQYNKHHSQHQYPAPQPYKGNVNSNHHHHHHHYGNYEREGPPVNQRGPPYAGAGVREHEAPPSRASYPRGPNSQRETSPRGGGGNGVVVGGGYNQEPPYGDRRGGPNGNSGYNRFNQSPPGAIDRNGPERGGHHQFLAGQTNVHLNHCPPPAYQANKNAGTPANGGPGFGNVGGAEPNGNFGGGGPHGPRNLLALDPRHPSGARQHHHQRGVSPNSTSAPSPPYPSEDTRSGFPPHGQDQRPPGNLYQDIPSRAPHQDHRAPGTRPDPRGPQPPIVAFNAGASPPDLGGDWVPGVKEPGPYPGFNSGFGPANAPFSQRQSVPNKDLEPPKRENVYHPPPHRRQEPPFERYGNKERDPSESERGRTGYPGAGGGGLGEKGRGGGGGVAEGRDHLEVETRDSRSGGIVPLLPAPKSRGLDHSPRGGAAAPSSLSAVQDQWNSEPRVPSSIAAKGNRSNVAGQQSPDLGLGPTSSASHPVPLFPPGVPPPSSGTRPGRASPLNNSTSPVSHSGFSSARPAHTNGQIQPLLGNGPQAPRPAPSYPVGGRGSGGSVGSGGSGAPSPRGFAIRGPVGAGSSLVTEQDRIFKKVRGILNKLTPDKFDKLSLELLNVGIDSPQILKGIILLIFEKALDEPKYSSLYAQLCRRLHDDAPNFDPPNVTSSNPAPASGNSSFSRLLLNKCKDEFENRYKATNEFELKRANNDGRPLSIDEEEQALIAKSKMLGNIKFIGELGKLNMLHERILHQCIKQLLERKKENPTNWSPEDSEMGKKKDVAGKAGEVEVKEAENLECLCHLMRTVGPRLDKPEAKAWMDAYFERIKAFRSNAKLPSRIRFMLQDIIDLRGQRWASRRIGMSLQDSGPRTIQQVREDAAKDLGINVKGLGQKDSASPDIHTLLYGASIGDPNADLFQDMGLFLPASQGGGAGMALSSNPLAAFELGRGGPDFFGSTNKGDQMSSKHGTSNDGGKGGKTVSFVEDILSGGGGGGGSGGNLPINLIGAGARRDDDEVMGGGGRAFGGEKRGGGLKLERMDSRGLTDRQENSLSQYDRMYERPEQRGRERGQLGRAVGEEEERGGGGEGRTAGGRRKEDGSSGRKERNSNKSASGGAAPWGKSLEEPRREKDGGSHGRDEDPVPSHRGGRGGKGAPTKREESFPSFKPEGESSSRFVDSDPAPGRGGRGGFSRRDENAFDSKRGADRRGDDFPLGDRGRGGRGVRGGKSGRGGRAGEERPRFNEGEITAAQEAAQIKNAIFPPQKLTLKSSVMPLNTEEISLRPASFGGATKGASIAKTNKSTKKPSTTTSTPTTDSGSSEQLTASMASLSVKNECKGKAAASPKNSRSATPSLVPSFDEARAVETLKALVTSAVTDLPNGDGSQRGTPEPDQDSESQATRTKCLEDVFARVKELSAPSSFVPTLFATVLTSAHEARENLSSRDVASLLLVSLTALSSNAEGIAGTGYERLLEQMPSFEATIPRIKAHVAHFVAQAVLSEELSLGQVATPLKGGAHFPLFLLALQAMVKDPSHKDEAEAKNRVKTLVDDSGVKLPDMVPQTSLPNLLSVFSDRGLGFLLPLLRLRVELSKAVNEDPTPKALYSWLQDHVDDPKMRASQDFIHVLTTVLLTYVTEQSTLRGDEAESSSQVPPGKEKAEQERQQLAKFSPILKKFVEDEEEDAAAKGGTKGPKKRGGAGGEMKRQIALVYSMQVFCHQKGWPKGMLLRLFTYMYDLEVVEEEAFLQWKEDINDAYPGKGKALFQVNQWLTWLEQAESEDEDDEDDS